MQMSDFNAPKTSTKSDKKKMLKKQIFEFRNRHSEILQANRSDNPKKKALLNSEREKIAQILQEAPEILEKRAIVGDIKSYAVKRAGKTERVLIFDCKYGLKQEIRNLNSFVDFCAIHGFVPLIDRILIEIDGREREISEIKELYHFFHFAMFENNPIIANTIANEIEKIEQSLATQGSFRELVSAVQTLTAYTTSTYQYLLGPKLQKMKNPGVLSENVFTEIALRIENQVREKV